MKYKNILSIILFIIIESVGITLLNLKETGLNILGFATIVTGIIYIYEFINNKTKKYIHE